jgi:hypothetical protein
MAAEAAVMEAPSNDAGDQQQAQNGTDFIKDAFAQAFGPESVKSAGEREARQAEDKARSESQTLNDKGKALVPDEQSRLEQEKADKTAADKTTAEETPEVDSEESTDAEPLALDQKGKARWGELKKEVKTYKTQLAELKKQLQEKSQDSEEVSQLRSELDARSKQLENYDKELYLTRVEATSEWKKTVEEPLGEIIDEVEIIANSNNIDGNELFDAIYKAAKGDRSAIKEIFEGLDTMTQQDIHLLSKNLIQVDRRKDDLKNNSKSAYETSMKNQTEQQAQYQEQSQKEYRQAAADIGEKFEARLKDVLPADHAVDFTTLRSESQSIDSWKPTMKVYAANAAAVLPDVLATLDARTKELATIKAENIRLRGGTAKSNTTGSASSAPKDAAKATSMGELASKSFEQLAQETVARMTGRG